MSRSCIELLSIIFLMFLSLDIDKSLNLDSLLFHLRTQVTPKWHQFGIAVGTPKELLDQLMSYPEEECMVEIVDYWLRHHPGQLTWVEVSRALRKIKLHQLADELKNGPKTDPGNIMLYYSKFWRGGSGENFFLSSEWIRVPSILKTDNKASKVEHSPTPPPVPPKILDDEKMDKLDSALTDSSVLFTDPHNIHSPTGRVSHNPNLNERAVSTGQDGHGFPVPPRPPKPSTARLVMCTIHACTIQ